MFKVAQDEINSNILKIRNWMKESNTDGFLVSSTDNYLSEYVPLDNCHRYYITGFTGSTAEVLVTLKNVFLFVDGRYHQQADLEVDSSVVTVMKTPHNKGNITYLIETAKENNIATLAYESSRTSLLESRRLEGEFTLNACELSTVLEFRPNTKLKEVWHVDPKFMAETTIEKLNRFMQPKTAHYLSALDSIAWITNCRGFHMPFQSTFLSRALVLSEMVYVFVDPTCPVNDNVLANKNIKFIKCASNEVAAELINIAANNDLEKVYFTESSTTKFDYEMLSEVFGETLEAEKMGLVAYHSVKTDKELRLMEDDFSRSNTAIKNTIKGLKEKFKNGEKITELDFYNYANEKYAETGAIDQSFKTIAAFGPNSSIIHYSDSSADVNVTEGEFLLYDSGALYESGYSTDTTRTFFVGGTPTAKHKMIYTLVLKGVLNGQYAVFPEGTCGADLDAVVRMPMYRHGFTYNHGTGHGVGIAVHEAGTGISSRSRIPFKPGNVLSIEPGIYLPGFGGVRLENIVEVVKHETLEGFMRFKPLVKIPFEEELIDRSLLNQEEIAWLEDYQELSK